MNLPENLKKKRDEFAQEAWFSVLSEMKFDDIFTPTRQLYYESGYKSGFNSACAELLPMIEKLEFEVYYAMKYLDSTGINNEKYEHEPEYMMLMGFKEVLAELKKWRE